MGHRFGVGDSVLGSGYRTDGGQTGRLRRQNTGSGKGNQMLQGGAGKTRSGSILPFQNKVPEVTVLISQTKKIKPANGVFIIHLLNYASLQDEQCMVGK